MGERTCFNCIYQKRCYTYKGVHDSTQYGMNIDSDDTPGTIRDIFEAVANACLDYKRE